MTVRWSADARKCLTTAGTRRQTTITNAVSRFIASPAASGRGYKQVRSASDRRLHELRAGRGDRILLLVEGSTALVLFAGKHDEALAWAARHRARLTAAAVELTALATSTNSRRAAQWKTPVQSQPARRRSRR
jgi:hypothetical protein